MQSIVDPRLYKEYISTLKVQQNKKTLTAIDLFAGAGGLSEALKSSGFNILGAIEFDKVYASTYAVNHGDHVLIDDICNVDCQKFGEKFNVIPRELDLLVGCSPCQGFSKQFKYKKNKKNTKENEVKKGEDKRNLLIFQYIRFVYHFQPKYIFFENVPGLMAHPWIFKVFIDKLSKSNKEFIGYHVSFGTVNAADYGVPQRRNRFVLIGKRKDLCATEINVKDIYPEPTHHDPKKQNNSRHKQPWVNLNAVIKHLPEIKAGEMYRLDPLHFAKNLSEENKVRLFYTPPNGGSRKDWPQIFVAWPPEANKAPLNLWLSCHSKSKKQVGYGDVYGRMDYNSVSPTLTGGCLSITKGRFAHPEQDRAISAREAALIQTFPPGYVFKGTKDQIAMQIGNAVPVKMGRVFIENIKCDLLKYLISAKKVKGTESLIMALNE